MLDRLKHHFLWRGALSSTLNGSLPLSLPLSLLPGLLLAVSGCTSWPLAPDAGEPRVSVPSTWTRALQTTQTQQGTEWWRQFGDATLEQLLNLALTAAPDRLTAVAKLRQVRAQQELADANLRPSLGVSAAATRSRSGLLAGGNDTSQRRYTGSFDASWELPIFGGLRNSAAAAAAATQSSVAELEAVQVSLAAEVVRNYLDLRLAQQRIQSAKQNLDSQQQTLQLAQWRTQSGLASQLEVEAARSSLEQSRAALSPLENSYATAAHHLAVLTGQAPGAIQQLLAEIRPLPAVPSAIAVDIPAAVLRQRPDVRAAALKLQAELERTKAAAAAWEPTLTLNGSLGWQAFEAALFGEGGSLVRSVAAQVAAKLFDGGRIRASFSAQDAVREQALVAYEKTILTALEDVENALAAYVWGRERVSAQLAAHAAAVETAQLTQIEYQSGMTDCKELLVAERTRLTAADNLLVAQGEVLAAVVALYKASAGGWPAATLSGVVSEDNQP